MTESTNPPVDPTLDPAQLAQLAQERPDLWQQIRRHPNCYSELAAWIDRHSRAPAPDKPSADQWAAAFQRTHGREPTMSEYQAAVSSGEIAKERRFNDASLHQMTDGLKQFAGGAKGLYDSRVAPAVERSGAKDFFNEKVAPTARSAAQRVQSEAAAPSDALGRWITRAPMLMPVVAFLAIIALFLPIGSMGGYSMNFFSEDAGGEGIMLMILFLAVIGCAIWHLATKRKLAAIVTIGLAAIAGIFGILDGFGNMIRISGESGPSVGLGIIALGLFGTCLLAGAVLMVLGLKNAKKA